MWIFVPQKFYQYVPGSADSNSELNWQSQTAALYVTWRGKHMPAKFWQNKCKQETWIARLFERILPPLIASHGVESWIALLADTPASHSAQQVDDLAKTTPPICGTQSQELSGKFSQKSASLKMSANIYLMDFTMSQKIFNVWVTKLRLACSARRSLVRLTKESDYLLWRTIKATEAMGGC